MKGASARAAAAALGLVLASSVAAQEAPAPPRPDPGIPAPAREPDLAAEKRERRVRLAALAGADAAVLVLSADDAPGFTGPTQSSDFTYVSPFDARGAAVAAWIELAPGWDATLRTSDALFLRPRNFAMERWTGAVVGPDAAARDAGRFASAAPSERLAADLAPVLRGRKTLYVSPGGPADAERRLAPFVAALRANLPGVWVRLHDLPGAGPEDLAESVRRALSENFPKDRSPAEALAALPVLDLRPARRLLAELRETKSAAEVARIRAATDATVEGMFEAIAQARPGMLEVEVAGIVELACRRGGCVRQAYPSIVGAGPNSCVLHHSAGDRPLAEGDMVVMDIGGEHKGYATDVTRSFPADGKFTDEQARVYDAVLAAQEAGIAAVRPGVTMKAVHAAASAVLKERGLLHHFIHGTSHSVGLDVHDPFRGEAPLRAGSVLTVEPGVYIAASGLGVRIEDTVLVTETGCEVLSAKLPKTRAAIEALMAR